VSIVFSIEGGAIHRIKERKAIPVADEANRETLQLQVYQQGKVFATLCNLTASLPVQNLSSSSRWEKKNEKTTLRRKTGRLSHALTLDVIFRWIFAKAESKMSASPKRLEKFSSAYTRNTNTKTPLSFSR